MIRSMKKIIVLMWLCSTGCAGLNQDMLASALNNADEQLVKECSCKKYKKTKKKSSKSKRHHVDMTKYDLFDSLENEQ